LAAAGNHCVAGCAKLNGTAVDDLVTTDERERVTALERENQEAPG